MDQHITLQKVGHVSAWNVECLDVYWRAHDRTIIVCELTQMDNDSHNLVGPDALYERGDGNIIETITEFLPRVPQQLSIEHIMVFDRHGQGKAADETLKREIYDCTWSDFACDNLVVHFNVCDLPTPQSPTCRFCEGEGDLFIAKDENIRCRDCFGLAVETRFLEEYGERAW